LKVSSNVKIAIQYFKNFGGANAPPLVARLVATAFYVLHYGESSAIISDNELIHLSSCYKYYYTIQGRNERVQGGSDSSGTEITAGGAENFQQRHTYFLQCSKFASMRPQVQI